MTTQNFTAENTTPVYFYFKQDCSYRGLEGAYSGQITIGDLVTLLSAYLSDEPEDEKTITDKFYKKYPNLDKVSWYSFFEAFCVIGNLTEELVKEQLVSCADELGYEAFSLKSIEHAKEEVKRLFVEDNF